MNGAPVRFIALHSASEIHSTAQQYQMSWTARNRIDPTKHHISCHTDASWMTATQVRISIDNTAMSNDLHSIRQQHNPSCFANVKNTVHDWQICGTDMNSWTRMGSKQVKHDGGWQHTWRLLQHAPTLRKQMRTHTNVYNMHEQLNSADSGTNS